MAGGGAGLFGWGGGGGGGGEKINVTGRLAVELQILRDESTRPLPALARQTGLHPLKQRQTATTGYPALRDRIQRAVLMAMEPIWESDFHTLHMASGLSAVSTTRSAR